MRYLNKVVFINSAAIRYSEVQLDGNIHLIGTQGVGKSTILRAILFFYNADTQRLGIPVEKKSYQDYYFPYADSSIIYEIAREDQWFTILSYKTMNRICYRFIASPYRPELFIDDNGAPYTSDRIKSVLDKNGIKYSGAISTYEEYRNILYGNSDNKRDYSGFSLMEGNSYQNIIRTIQNVLLNSRLEADYIKQTIISSLNEDNNVIDLSRYRSHLSGFESQLTDISIFRDPAVQRKAVVISTLSDDIRKRELKINDLCRRLRTAYLQTESQLPELSRRIHEKEEIKTELYKQRDKLDFDSKSKTSGMEAELAVLRNALADAETKQKYYAGKNIQSAMERCSKMEVLLQEQSSLTMEKDLLSSQNKEASVLYANLLANLKNELASFENEKQKQLLTLEGGINSRRESRREHYSNRKEELRHNIAEEKERLFLDREQSNNEIANLQHQIRSTKNQPSSTEELEIVKTRLNNFESNRKDLELKIRELKYELNYQTKEFETTGKRLEEDYQKLKETNETKIEAINTKIAELSDFLNNQKDTFFSWLSENKPGWEQTIGQVCNEKLLYGKDFNAEIGEGDSFYGVRFTPRIYRSVKTKEDYLIEKKEEEGKLSNIRQFLATAQQDLETARENLRKQYQSSSKPIKDDIYNAEYELEQLAVRKKEDESRLIALNDHATQVKQELIKQLEEELNRKSSFLTTINKAIAALQSKMDKDLSILASLEKEEQQRLDKELAQGKEHIFEEIRAKQAYLEERKAGYDKEQIESLAIHGGDPKRLEEIHSRLKFIATEIKYINENKPLIIEYLKDKREIIDKISDWQSESLRLQQIINSEREELKRLQAEINRTIAKEDTELKELKELNRKALENRDEYHRSIMLDWFTSREDIFSSLNRIETDDDCRTLVREITVRVSEQSKQFSELRKEIVAYVGNFSEDNVFAFRTSFSDDKAYMDFSLDLKEFIEENKISEYLSRINTRNSDIFRQITVDTKSMMSQEGSIRNVVDMINADFKEKNFVGIIQCIEMRIDPSQNKIVNLLKEIKRFNEEFSWDLGQNLFTSSSDDTIAREKATALLRELIKSMDVYAGNFIRLGDFFDLKFRVIENKNDTGFVERLTNVGSEGTDILVKSMINIMLINVFKMNASCNFSTFKLHCMMDEIGKLHPNNMAGILKFANDRGILLINGSPTEQDAMSYKHIYKLEKDHDSFTRIRRIITQFE